MTLSRDNILFMAGIITLCNNEKSNVFKRQILFSLKATGKKTFAEITTLRCFFEFIINLIFAKLLGKNELNLI